MKPSLATFLILKINLVIKPLKIFRKINGLLKSSSETDSNIKDLKIPKAEINKWIFMKKTLKLVLIYSTITI